MNRKGYNSDPRYAKVLEKMDLLGIMDITTTRQDKNGTITWKLPIKNYNSGKTNIEVASFASGYVRNNNSGYSNYQLNKRCESEPDYYKIERNGETLYRKFTTRTCKLIPIEIDRLEYLISYCLKNYYIKHANFVANGFMSILNTVHFFIFAAIIENIPTPPNMLTITSPSLTNSAIRVRSDDNLGEKNTFRTSTRNLHPDSLYSVSVLSSPAKISKSLVLNSPSTEDD